MKRHIALVLFFLAFTPAGLFAQQNNPVIQEALKLAASLDGDSKIQANAAIQRANLRLGTGNQGTGTLRESLEAAKEITDERQRSRVLLQIAAENIVPENVNSYDEILKEYLDPRSDFLDHIFRQCLQTRKYELGYQLYERFLEHCTDPEVKKRYYSWQSWDLSSLIVAQITEESLEAAIASANRLKDPEIRQSILDRIKKVPGEHLMQYLRSDTTIEANREAMRHFLKKCYPDIDTSDWSKSIVSAVTKMSEEVEKIEEADVRFDAYRDLINAYRRGSMSQPEYAFDFEQGVPLPPKPVDSPDPALSKLLFAAAEAAKNVKEDSGNFTRQKRLAIAVRWMIENADSNMANQFVDQMLTIPTQIENPSMRATAMLDVIPLLYQLDRKDEANNMCDAVLKLANSTEGQRYGLSNVLTEVVTIKANAGLFEEAKKLTQTLPERRNLLYDERLVRGFAGAYSSHITRLLVDERYEDALQFIEEEPEALGDKIRLLNMVADAYHRAGNTIKSNETYKKMFELVDVLAEKEAEKEASGRPDNLGIQEDRRGGQGASLAKTYSHPIVKSRRERGDFAGAVDLAKKLFSTHAPGVQILSIARGYAEAGDYASALEVGGSAGGEFCSDSGIRGYTAHAMLRHGKKEEAEKLLAETLHEVDNGTMTLHRDFIVGLLLCGRIDDAIRLSTARPVADRSEHSEPTDQYAQQPTILLQCLLMTDHEAEAVKLVDEWKQAAGKAWGIGILIRWNHEEHLGQGVDSLITPELKKRWTDFLINYADTLEEPNAINRIGEWYRAAECLIDLDANEAALKVLDKALVDVPKLEQGLPDHIRSNSIHVRVQTGRMLVRLGEYEKADIAFVAAVKEGTLYEKEYRKAESLKYTLFDYTEALQDKPEDIRTWSGYGKSENDRRIRTLRYLWERRLFSQYMIM